MIQHINLPWPPLTGIWSSSTKPSFRPNVIVGAVLIASLY